MALPAAEIQRMIAEAFPGSETILKDLAGDNEHFAIEIISPAFEGKTRIQQHQMVYEALGGKMGTTLHALSIKTRTPSPHGE